MCNRIEDQTDGVCLNTRCEHHLCYDGLYLAHPNLHSPIGWCFLNCDKNLEVLGELEEKKFGFITLEQIGEMWGITRERVRQIETKALNNFRRNLKTISKEETQDGEDSTERPRSIRVTRSRRLSVSWQEGSVQTPAGLHTGVDLSGVVNY